MKSAMGLLLLSRKRKMRLVYNLSEGRVNFYFTGLWEVSLCVRFNQSAAK